MSPLHPGQLPPFRFETETKPKSKPIRPNRIRSKQVRLNVAERRAATRVSVSELRRRKLKEFDYEAYRADFAKRYISTNLIHWYFRLLDLQHTHDDLEENERDWPPQLPDPKTLYADFYNKIHDLLYNIICASCGCIGHYRSDYTLVYGICPRPTTFLFEVRTSYSRSLQLFLRNLWPRRTKHYDRSPRDTARRLGLERVAMRHLSSQYHAWEKTPWIARQIWWVGPVPDELKNLTWSEELLVADAHIVGRGVRLQA